MNNCYVSFFGGGDDFVVVHFVAEAPAFAILKAQNPPVLNVDAASYHRSLVPTLPDYTASHVRRTLINGCQNLKSDKTGKLCAANLSYGNNFSPQKQPICLTLQEVIFFYFLYILSYKTVVYKLPFCVL
jgi:hypothetical protein